MAIPYLKVTTDRMLNDVDDLTSYLTHIKTCMQELCTAMDTLLSYWDGPASEAEMQVYQAERQNIDQLCKLVEELIDEMSNDASAYNICEQQVADAVNSLRI